MRLDRQRPDWTEQERLPVRPGACDFRRADRAGRAGDGLHDHLRAE